MSKLHEKGRGSGGANIAIVGMRPKSNHTNFAVLRQQRRHTYQYQQAALHDRKSSRPHIMMNNWVRRMNSRWSKIAALALTLVCLAGLFSTEIADTDFWWHLK